MSLYAPEPVDVPAPRVEDMEDGTFYALDADERTIDGPFSTEAEALEAIDRHEAAELEAYWDRRIACAEWDRCFA